MSDSVDIAELRRLNYYVSSKHITRRFFSCSFYPRHEYRGNGNSGFNNAINNISNRLFFVISSNWR